MHEGDIVNTHNYKFKVYNCRFSEPSHLDFFLNFRGSMCSHFNPYNMTHGCPGMIDRHVGDLGNLQTNNKGEAKYSFYDDCIKLRGTKANIIGRGLIIHEDPDDCGQGGNTGSLKTGNAGKRIACAVIGYSKDNFTC